jgi:hypothetical protein
MPISGQGWELQIIRQGEQRRDSDGKRRTVGRYQVFHDGVAQTGSMRGTTAESRGPGANRPVNNGKRIEQGRYPLRTHGTKSYATLNFKDSQSPSAHPKPAIAVGNTDKREGILIHPGNGFLRSIGCINLCASLPNRAEMIDYVPSRKRVIAMIEDLKSFLGQQFPAQNGKKIPNAFVVIDGEP